MLTDRVLTDRVLTDTAVGILAGIAAATGRPGTRPAKPCPGRPGAGPAGRAPAAPVCVGPARPGRLAP
ncbi:hypothetical protein [Streptomyces roseolus]|uniref:hypothetical protein n=1 Tax=Streptomyces roseolus TaxID=67358 RepID=UPI001675D333|nr:hypothetical protein [Streptomyces roseolus]GGR26661.1 hypothetical protein GCM10010282_18800 [Streptomyces roseolus]